MTYDKENGIVKIDNSDVEFMDKCYSMMNNDERENGPKSLYRALKYSAKINGAENDKYAEAAKALEEAKILEISPEVQSVPDEMFSGNGKGKDQHFEKIILAEDDNKGVQKVGNEAFKNCTCSEFNVANTVTRFGERALYGFTCPEISLMGPTGKPEDKVKDDRLHLGEECLAYSHVDSVKLSDYAHTASGVLCGSTVKQLDLGCTERISEAMCDKCHELKTVNVKFALDPLTNGWNDGWRSLYRSRTTVGPRAFRNCKNLVDLNTSGLEVLGDQAFYGCKNWDISTQNFDDVLEMRPGSLEKCKHSSDTITVGHDFGEIGWECREKVEAATGLDGRQFFQKPLKIKVSDPIVSKPETKISDEKESETDNPYTAKDTVMFENLPYFSEEAYKKKMLGQELSRREAGDQLRKQYGESYFSDAVIRIVVDNESYHANLDIGDATVMAITDTGPDSNAVSIMSIAPKTDMIFEQDNVPDGETPKRLTAQELSEKMSLDEDLAKVEDALNDEASLLEGISIDDLAVPDDDVSDKINQTDRPASVADNGKRPESDKTEHKDRSVTSEMEKVTEEAEKKKQDEKQDDNDDVPD